MARTEITKQTATRGGSTVTFGPVTAAAAPNGHYFNTAGAEKVLIKNTGVGANTMVVDVVPVDNSIHAGVAARSATDDVLMDAAASPRRHRLTRHDDRPCCSAWPT